MSSRASYCHPEPKARDLAGTGLGHALYGIDARFFGADAPQNDRLAHFMATRALFKCHPEPKARDLAGTGLGQVPEQRTAGTGVFAVQTRLPQRREGRGETFFAPTAGYPVRPKRLPHSSLAALRPSGE